MPRDPAEPQPKWLSDIRQLIERIARNRERRHELANKLMVEWGRAALLQEETRKLIGRG